MSVIPIFGASGTLASVSMNVRTSRKNAPQLEVEADGTYPERRLWSAVLIATFHEYEEWCKRISTTWETTKRPVNRNFRDALEAIRRECKTPWFSHICEMVELSPDCMHRKLELLDNKYNVTVTPYSDGPVQVLTRHMLDKLKNNSKRIIRHG